MSFKGEIALGVLNSKYKYGFTVGDIYRVQGAGNLVPNNYPAKNGEFVEWTATGWKHSDTAYVTNDEVAEAISDMLDDHDPDDLVIFDGSKEFYDEHELGYYYALGDKIYLCTEHTRSDEEGTYTYSTKLTKQNGIVPVLNQFVGRSGGGMLSVIIERTSKETDADFKITNGITRAQLDNAVNEGTPIKATIKRGSNTYFTNLFTLTGTPRYFVVWLYTWQSNPTLRAIAIDNDSNCHWISSNFTTPSNWEPPYTPE